MQIKQFEAADMTEALRLVKREFGDDAVILSAKEVRPRGFFRSLRKKHVEIRAARDHSAADPPSDDEFSGLLAKQLDDLSSADRVSLSTTHPCGVQGGGGTPRRPLGAADDTGDGPSEAGVSPTPSTAQRPEPMDDPTTPTVDGPRRRSRFSPRAQPAGDRVRHPAKPSRLIAAPFFNNAQGRAVIAVVGPPGSGKSTSVGKLAWRCRVIERQRVGLISLDHFRFAANSLLQRIAEIMEVPFELARDAESMQCAVARLADVDVVLVDTPGIGLADRARMEATGRLLQLTGVDETHLVVNASVRDEILAATVDAFSTVGADRLLPSHWDEHGDEGLPDFLDRYGLPCAFYADGIDLWDDLRTPSSDEASRWRPSNELSVGRVTAFPGNPRRRSAAAAVDPAALPSRGFVANRNSELVHRPNCKSVKRINAQNIAAFDTIEEAIGEGFKPCRACCDIDVIRQAAPIARWQPLAKAM